MKRVIFSLVLIVVVGLTGCDRHSDSDSMQRRQQEEMLKEATAQTGMPSVKNFRERKMLKDIIELRDQEGLVTWTYLENMNPVRVEGSTSLGGKLTYLGQTIGYGIPYATQYTNPMKYEYTSITLPQADPNGLFSPASAEGTWILLKDPNGPDVRPVYVELRIVVSPFKLKMD